MSHSELSVSTAPNRAPKWMKGRWAQVLDLPPITEMVTRPAEPCVVRSCDRLAQTFGLCPVHLQMARDRFSPNGFDRVSRRTDRMLAEAQARAGSRS